LQLQYRYDDGLEFLQYVSNEELEFFVDLFQEKAKLTQTLTSQKEYQNYFPDHKQYWELIAAELQYFGGNSFSNVVRKKGVLYKDIVIDICQRENINYDKNADVAHLEKLLVFEVLKKSIHQMDENDIKEFKTKWDIFAIEEIEFLNALRKKIFTEKEFFKTITTDISNSLGKNLLKQGIKVVLPLIAKKFVQKSVGGVIAGAVLSAKDLSDPAFRITRPSVFYIASLRAKYADKDAIFRKKYLPKVGSIVRVSLGGDIADHSGIYIGDNKIVEIQEQDSKGCVVVTDLYDFVYSSSVRTGVSIYVAIDLRSKEVLADDYLVKNAKKYIGYENKYELFQNNCHSFVHKCIANIDFAETRSGVWMFKDLTKSIEKYLNNEKEVAWVVCDINPKEHKQKKLNWKIEDEVVCRKIKL